MNASLAALSRQVVGSFREALAQHEIAAPFYISQNDGRPDERRGSGALPGAHVRLGPHQ